MDVIKKVKRLRVLEPSIGILGFFLVMVCVVFFLFLLDHTSVKSVVGFGLSAQQNERFLWLAFDGNANGSRKKIDFLSENGERCNLFEGDWVYDESYPLYQSKDCRFLDQGFKCSENGRPDFFYTKWRWQPKDCNLPRFDAGSLLEKLRNKRLVFVGDSIGRNQWESLLCMLSSAVSDESSIHEVNGNPITKHKGFLVFKFMEYNCTVEYYRAPFLVLQSRPPADIASKIRTTIKLDQIDWTASKWRDADVLVFNTGHWWNYEKTIRGGCYFQEGSKVKMKMSVNTAYRKSLKTLLKWIRNEVNATKTQVFLRTYSPVHFRGGDWRSGGTCHLEKLPELGSSLVPSHAWAQHSILADVISGYSNMSAFMSVLNITHMSSRRKDGHSSLYYLGPKASRLPPSRQDCSHWCLPGVPDAWNEILYALYLKHLRSNSYIHVQL